VRRGTAWPGLGTGLAMIGFGGGALIASPVSVEFRLVHR
jgi:hypothetical protein